MITEDVKLDCQKSIRSDNCGDVLVRASSVVAARSAGGSLLEMLSHSGEELPVKV